MKKVLAIIALFSFFQNASAQMDLPEFQIEKSEVEGHLRFLSSDALQGRRTGEPGNNLAAQYLSEYFKAYGVDQAPNTENYFQTLNFVATHPPQSARLTIGKTAYEQGDNLLILTGDPTSINKTKTVFAGHGWVDDSHDDYENLDVRGKIVLVLPGTPKGDDNQTVFRSMDKKRELAAEKGAVAIIELYRLASFPWDFFKSYFGKETLKLMDPKKSAVQKPSIVYGWLKEGTKAEMARLQSPKSFKATLSNTGFRENNLPSQNVIGVIEGSDPELSNEYIVLTAHYDHVGTGKNGNGAFSAKDSIFNGARDNAMGTVALLSAAKSLAAHPPRRSVVLLAVTAEEIGLLGSRYYAEHPLIPLDKTVFNLNTDGAGYSDKGIISVIGFGRTGTDAQIKKGVESVGLEVFADPAPEQNLFDRSDNVNFAAKGVPCLSFSPGFKSFDAEIAKHYHQVSDEADTVDFDYLLKFCQSFAHTARLLADMDKRPFWISGDKYEKAGKNLYNH